MGLRDEDPTRKPINGLAQKLYEYTPLHTARNRPHGHNEKLR